MTLGSVVVRTTGIGLLLLSGCDVVRSARDDLAALTGPGAAAPQPQKRKGPPPAATTAPKKPTATVRGETGGTVEASAAVASAGADGSSTASPTSLALTGKSETELRALLGAPTSEEARPPGKQWRYRQGSCTLDVQLYPDVETKQFGTLAYKVKSDDNTDEGNRVCLAQFQSRAHAR